MEFKIPKSFKLFNKKIVVDKRSDMMEMSGLVGYTGYYGNNVFLQSEDSTQTREEVVVTFFHELTHHILNQMGESELSKNEVFVSTFSGLLAQAIESAE